MHKSRRFSAKRQRLFLLCAGLLMVGASTVISLSALEDNLVFFYTPSSLDEKGISQGETFRLGGLVKEGSVSKQGSEVSFIVTDGTTDISVTYDGILPNLFREGQGVVAEGILVDKTNFRATSVLAKHDENYMPQEMKKTLEKRGLWQDKAP